MRQGTRVTIGALALALLAARPTMSAEPQSIDALIAAEKRMGAELRERARGVFHARPATAPVLPSRQQCVSQLPHDGMTEDQVRNSMLGRPAKTNISVVSGQAVQQWIYPSSDSDCAYVIRGGGADAIYVYFRDGVMVGIQY